MFTTPTLATRFANSTRVLRSEQPLTEDRMRLAAPSIFAAGKHVSRSDRYAYIPTIDVLRGLQHEGFEPFMVAQGHSRIEGKAAYTKHMVRLRQVDQPGQVPGRPEVNEIILINSHDGASSYQLLAGQFRFVCCNGLVVGDVAHDIRIPHRQSKASDLRSEVIEGAFRVVEDFEARGPVHGGDEGHRARARRGEGAGPRRADTALRRAHRGSTAAAHQRRATDASRAGPRTRATACGWVSSASRKR